MKHKAHAWIALRALKLIEDSNKAAKLSELLFFYLPDVWEGTWLPDTIIGNFRPDHIFKMDSDARFLGDPITDPRMLVSRSELDRRLTGRRLCLDWVRDSDVFRQPYRSHPEPGIGGRLPNRVLALGHNLSDMLRMGDFPLWFYARNKRPRGFRPPGSRGDVDLAAVKLEKLSPSPNFSARQIAMTFFILSHYIADAHMPLHCDLRDFKQRDLGLRVSKRVHERLEQYWEDKLPSDEELDALEDATLNQVVTNLPAGSLLRRLNRDGNFALSTRLTKIKGDEWKEIVNICRVSYAVSREWIPDNAQSLDDIVGAHSQAVLDDVSTRIFHDAVESVARIWLTVWDRFVGE